MSKKLIVGNWKMHYTAGQASLFLDRLQKEITAHRDVETVVCPNFLALQPLSLQVDRHKLKLGAQNCYSQDEGAFTGEISATMLRHLVDYVLVGHSERRRFFNETDREVAAKVAAVLRNQMQPILCVGETHQERVEEDTVAVLHGQVSAGLSNISSDEINRIVIAYEPVWSIGNGQVANINDAVVAIRVIRKQVKALFGSAAAEAVRVLYGGSVSSSDATSYLKAEGVDGLLIGATSLQAPDFARIIDMSHQLVSDAKL